MAVGEGLISAQGYESGGTETVPVEAALLASLPALLILVTPCLAAVVLGRRASREGDPRGAAPAWIGGVIGAATVLLNLLAFVLGR
jgi:hypothetical protein